jgi:hypothetical protein
MNVILLKLICAHIICDFLLQTKKTVNNKRSNNKRKKIYSLAIHSLIHAIVSYVIVAQWSGWYIPIILFITHFLIDWWKSLKKDSISYFILDQCLHLLVITGLWLYVTGQFCYIGLWIDTLLYEPKFWSIVIAYLLMLNPASLLISLFIQRWNPDVKPKKDEKMLTPEETETLQKAGQWIGYLERSIILTFMIMDYAIAIGFLFTAKSIFRIGDLRPGHNLKLTEYVLIGTFSSFFIAIVAGILIK